MKNLGNTRISFEFVVSERLNDFQLEVEVETLIVNVESIEDIFTVLRMFEYNPYKVTVHNNINHNSNNFDKVDVLDYFGISQQELDAYAYAPEMDLPF